MFILQDVEESSLDVDDRESYSTAASTATSTATTTASTNSSSGDYQDDDDEDEDNDNEEDDENEEDDFDDNFQFGVCTDDDVELSIEISREVGDFLLLCRSLVNLINGSIVLSFSLVLFIF
jgi:hypothetical protein